MLARAGLLALVLTIAACGSSPAADSGTTSGASGTTTSGVGCGPASATTVASDSVARVYSSGGSIFGCVRGASRVYRLGNAQICIRVGRAGPVALSGTLVGYGFEVCGVDTGSSEVIVQRLSDGHKLRTEAAVTGRVGPESYEAVASIALKSDGAVAWIVHAYSPIRYTHRVEVHRADRRGTATLDSGLGIYPESLRLRGSTLTWRHGTATRTASLL